MNKKNIPGGSDVDAVLKEEGVLDKVEGRASPRALKPQAEDLTARPEIATRSIPAPLGRQSGQDAGSRAESWLVLVLCASVLVARMLEQLIRHGLALAHGFAPDWIALAATGLAAARIVGFPEHVG